MRRKVQQKISHFSAANCSLRPKLRKMLYSVLAEQIILFVVSIWYSNYNNVVIQYRLISMKRALLLCVTKYYSTIYMDALHIFAWILSLDLGAKINRNFTARVHWQRNVEMD